MILSPEVYKKIKSVVFTRLEPSVTTVFWARPSTPEGNGFDFFVYDNGEWQLLNQYENVIIPKVDAHLSAFINDVNFYSIPLGGIPLKDLSNAVQSALNSAYQIPSTGIPKTDLSNSVQSSLDKAETALQEETDPTVPNWAKSPNKPSYNAQEVGALPANTPLFSGSYNDLSDKPTIPSKTSDLTNDSKFVSTNSQTFTDAEKEQARQNIGAAGTGDVPTLPDNVSYFSNDSGEGIIPMDGIRAVTVASAAAITVNPDVVTVINGAVGTAAITLQVPNDNLAHVWDILMTTDSSVAVTFAMSNGETILTPSGFSLSASKAVEVSVIGVGTKYYLRYGEFA